MKVKDVSVCSKLSDEEKKSNGKELNGTEIYFLSTTLGRVEKRALPGKRKDIRQKL